MRNSVTRDTLVITGIFYHELPFDTVEGDLSHAKLSFQ